MTLASSELPISRLPTAPRLPLAALTLAGLLAACGGGGGDGQGGPQPPPPPPPPTAPAAPALTLNVGLKQLGFSWGAVANATTYRLFQNPDGASGFTQVGADFAAATTSTAIPITVFRHNWGGALYRLEACNTVGCTASNTVNTAGAALLAIGYFKSSNAETGDVLGHSGIAVSADGTTLAVGAGGESSGADGVGGDQADNSADAAGAVYVFVRGGAGWAQQAYLKASNSGAGDLFGLCAVALSADGNTLAVGAHGEDSAARGINGNQADESAPAAGAVYVFVRTGTTWSQQAYLKASNADAGDEFGFCTVALSEDGNTLAVGAPEERSGANGVNGDQSDNSSLTTGAVYVFTRNATTWSQQAYIKSANSFMSDFFGSAVSLSGDGNTLAVGAAGDSSGSDGIGGNDNDGSAPFAGAVYVFTRTGIAWTQQAYLKASNSETNDFLGGLDVALDRSGNTLAVGAYLEDSAATGVGGNGADNSRPDAGAVYVFSRSGANWSQPVYIKASNPDFNDMFGQCLSLSGDGRTLAVGAQGEASGADGINGNQADNGSNEAGAVYVYELNGGAWSQRAYVKAPNSDTDDWFGYCAIALSDDGGLLAVGAPGEESAARGIGGNQNDNSLTSPGAVYLY